MGIKFTSYVPTSLNSAVSGALLTNCLAVTSASPTLAAEAVTGLPIATGANPGERFYLDTAQAAALSSPYFPCYAGWYRVVLVDSGTTATTTGYGQIGAMVTLAKGENTVTDGGHVLTLGAVPVVFLGVVVPGTYTIVQDLSEGLVNVLVGTAQIIVPGSVLVSTPAGTVALSAAISLATLITTVGMSLQTFTTVATGTITTSAVAAPSGGVAVYTVSGGSGVVNYYKGAYATIAGYSGGNVSDNGTFLCVASTSTTLTLQNPNAVANAAAGTVATQAFVQARAGAPFAI